MDGPTLCQMNRDQMIGIFGLQLGPHLHQSLQEHKTKYGITASVMRHDFKIFKAKIQIDSKVNGEEKLWSKIHKVNQNTEYNIDLIMFVAKMFSFFFPDLQSLSRSELNETCQLLDNFLDSLNFPLLSTIRIGQGTYYMSHTSITIILCGNIPNNTATHYQQLKALSARKSLNTGMIMIWLLWPWSQWLLTETLSCLIISLTASTAPPQTVSI